MQGGFEGRVAPGLTPAAIAVWLAMSAAETDREGQWAGRSDFR